MAFYDQDIPAWMNPARNVLETGREATPGIGHNFAAAFLQQQENKTDLTKLRVEELRQGIEINKIKIGQMAEGSQEVAAWMKESKGDPVWMVNNPYTGTNPIAAERIADAQLRASQSVAVSATKKDATNFYDGLQGISGQDRAAIIGTIGQGGIPTANSWQMLNDARKRAGLPPAGMPDTLLKPPASVQEVDEIMKTEREANEAESLGDYQRAKQLRDRASLLREQMKGQEVVTGYDSEGRPIVRVGKGVGGSVGIPTVGTQTQAQQKLLKYENTIQLMSHLESTLKPEHVGAVGVAGEWIVDRTLSQMFPEMANKERIDVRSAMVAMREGLMREMSNDPRFSNLDREEISRALPSSGIFESVTDAKQRMATVRNIISQRAAIYARSLGQKPPIWSLTPEEIKEAFNKGELTKEQALDALVKYH